MSKLDSFIRRLLSQIECLNAAHGLMGDIPGDILELGLGNGRTCDHLRRLFASRRCVVIETDASCFHRYRGAQPDDSILGDVREVLPRIPAAQFALVHSDLGDWHPDKGNAVMVAIRSEFARLLVAGGVLVSGIPVTAAGLRRVQGIPSIPDRYFVYVRE